MFAVKEFSRGGSDEELRATKKNISVFPIIICFEWARRWARGRGVKWEGSLPGIHWCSVPNLPVKSLFKHISHTFPHFCLPTSPLPSRSLEKHMRKGHGESLYIYIYIYINAPYSTIQVLYALLWSSHLQTARHRLKMIQYHPLWQSPRPGPWIVGFWGSCVRRSGKDDRFVLFSLKINKVVTGVEFWKGGGFTRYKVSSISCDITDIRLYSVHSIIKMSVELRKLVFAGMSVTCGK